MCRDPFHFPFLRKNIRNSFFIFFLDKREKNCYTIDMYEKSDALPRIRCAGASFFSHGVSNN